MEFFNLNISFEDHFYIINPMPQGRDTWKSYRWISCKFLYRKLGHCHECAFILCISNLALTDLDPLFSSPWKRIHLQGRNLWHSLKRLIKQHNCLLEMITSPFLMMYSSRFRFPIQSLWWTKVLVSWVHLFGTKYSATQRVLVLRGVTLCINGFLILYCCFCRWF